MVKLNAVYFVSRELFEISGSSFLVEIALARSPLNGPRFQKVSAQLWEWEAFDSVELNLWKYG